MADRIYLDSMKTYRWYEDRQTSPARAHGTRSTRLENAQLGSSAPALSAEDCCGSNSCDVSNDSDAEDDDDSETPHKLTPEGSKMTCGTSVSRPVSPEPAKISATPTTGGAKHEKTDFNWVQPAIRADEGAKRKKEPSRRRLWNRKSPRAARGPRVKKETALADEKPACKFLRLSFGIQFKGNEKRVLEVRNRLEIDLSSLIEK